MPFEVHPFATNRSIDPSQYTVDAQGNKRTVQCVMMYLFAKVPSTAKFNIRQAINKGRQIQKVACRETRPAAGPLNLPSKIIRQGASVCEQQV